MLVYALNTSYGLERPYNSALMCCPHQTLFSTERRLLCFKQNSFFFTFMANSWTLSPTHTGWVWPSTRPGLKTNRYHHIQRIIHVHGPLQIWDSFSRAQLTAPFNNMRTLKFKAQPTRAFFATVNQMFAGSTQLLTAAENVAIKSLCRVQTTNRVQQWW